MEPPPAEAASRVQATHAHHRLAAYSLLRGRGAILRTWATLDGYNMWEALSRGWRSPRKEVLINIDPVTGAGALRYGKHKIVYDAPFRGSSDVHVKTTGQPRPTSPAEEELNWLMENSQAAKALRMLYNTNRLPLRYNWRRDSMVDCGVLGKRPSNFVSQQPPYLFDLEIDPCEMFNLAKHTKKDHGHHASHATKLRGKHDSQPERARRSAILPGKTRRYMDNLEANVNAVATTLGQSVS
ncbi:hypothetical protein MTO96_022620 [Rhipicephalus appendiculatus]